MKKDLLYIKKTKMKVLHITNNFPTENLPIFGIFVKEQIDSLAALGVENEIFFMNTREKGKKEYIKGYFKLIKLLFQNKYDIIHCHHAYSGFIFICTGLSFFTKRILSYQGTPDIEGGRFIFNISNRFFDSIILKANFQKYKSNKTEYLPNGTNIEFFKPLNKEQCKQDLGLDLKKQYVLFMDSYVGRPFKRYDRFKAVTQLLREKYAIKNLGELVLTNTKRELIPQYINASSFHLLTSDVEGSPNSVKECLACNIPVVSTPVGNANEIIGDVKGCYISKTFDPEELANLCEKVLKAEDFNGREDFLSKKLDIGTVAKSLLSVYEKIIKK